MLKQLVVFCLLIPTRCLPESDYQRKLESVAAIDGVVIISASGSKHASQIAEYVAERGLTVTLITNTANSPAERALSGADVTVVVMPKNREPYTYNTSTYLGMIMAARGEDPAGIKNFIESTVSELDFDLLGEHDKFYLIVPPRFAQIIRMLEVKFIELFGRNIARDVETSEYVAHATTVAPANEVFISFGEENTTWGDPSRRLYIPLPDDAGYGAMMAIGYYVISQVQSRQPDYFKQNIAEYTQRISDIFGGDIQPIVPRADN